MNGSAGGIRFDERGLAPCVVQDWRSGEVLTLAYVDAEAIERSRATGEMHFFSRSRGRLWRKGETSGNVQRLRELRYDCDCDAVLALVEPVGPACHTGERSCFYRELGGAAEPVVDGPPVAGEPAPAAFEALGALERVVRDRDRDRPPDSYTAELLDDPPRVGAKVREEADEVARAAAGESDERVAEEAADLLYHLAVLVRSRGLELSGALEVLNDRRTG
jgi:phosphoribosyl-ATP pyrophosphohydrolase/phosphoribosyl-AMP cyclohydrolase